MGFLFAPPARLSAPGVQDKKVAGRRPEWQRDKRIIAGDSLGMNKYIRKWGMCARTEETKRLNVVEIGE